MWGCTCGRGQVPDSECGVVHVDVVNYMTVNGGCTCGRGQLPDSECGGVHVDVVNYLTVSVGVYMWTWSTI